MAYDYNIIVEVRRLFVNEGYRPEQIAELMGGKPAASTIRLWARTADPSTGIDWWEERDRLAQAKYEQVSPEATALRLWERLHDELDKAGPSADSVRKYITSIRDIIHPKYNIPVLYALLHELSEFAETYNPDLVTEAFYDLLEAFKTHQRAKAERHPLA